MTGLFGREYELTIHVISPFHENAENQFVIQSHSLGRDELLVVMPPDDRVVRDLLMYKRTEKYIRQNISITQQETLRRILTDKGFRTRNAMVKCSNGLKDPWERPNCLSPATCLDINWRRCPNQDR
jgi:hypothetical protein